MEQRELQALAEAVSLEFFQQPFLHKVVFNARLRTTAGRYLHNTHMVEINPHYYRIHGREELIATIKHELCHYHLALRKLPFDHRAAEFRILLQQVGGTRFAKPSPEMANKKSLAHCYVCTQCSQLYQRRRRINTRRYVCGKCQGRLQIKSQDPTI